MKKGVKIYKTLQREAKMLGMDRTIAMQFIACSTVCLFLILILTGASFFSLLLAIVSIVLFFIFFKRKHKNKILYKIKQHNKKKPLVIKTKQSIILNLEHGFFN